MTIVLPVVDVGGVKTCGRETHTADFYGMAGDGSRFYLYGRQASRRPAGHEHWMLSGVGNAQLSNDWHAAAVEDVAGVVYQLKWRDIETGFNQYNLTALVNAANYLLSRGKRMIFRLFWKTYLNSTDAPVDPPLPAKTQVPDYILNDPVTYGGTEGRGGLYRQYTGGSTPFGWCARLDNPNVNARFRALIDEIAQVIANHPALQGAMFDESTWSIYGPTGLPDGLTGAVQIQTMKDLYLYLQSKFPNKEIYPNVNYTEGTYQDAIDLQDWCIQQSMLVGVTDTFRIGDMWNGKQPVYDRLPRPVKTLVHVDYMSMGAEDSGVRGRMIENALMTARLGANITAWYLQGGSAGIHWAAIKNAMRVIG